MICYGAYVEEKSQHHIRVLPGPEKENVQNNKNADYYDMQLSSYKIKRIRVYFRPCRKSPSPQDFARLRICFDSV